MSGKKVLLDEVARGLQPLYPRLWRYCIVLTGQRERADDLAQATCVRALEKSAYYQSGTKLDRWTFRIAQRLWLNELRSDAVRRGGGLRPIEEIEIPDGGLDPEMNFSVREVLLEVLALPEAQRIAVFLVYVEGYSYREAAEMLDIPIGTVMSRLSASRAKLAGKFKPKKRDVG
ncbi:MAG: RNA polymerase sigma factor [Pseudomonadota bacterium]